MIRNALLYGFLIGGVWASGSTCSASISCCAKTAQPDPNGPPDQTSLSLKQITGNMRNAAEGLSSLQADLVYLFIQDPELLDAKTLRKGLLYYTKSPKKSKLRISFNTVQQDEEEPVIQPEHYLFDGVWLTKIDMKLETIDLYQKAPADQPVGVFDFISHNFPMVGFTDPSKLEKEFEISLAPVSPDPNEPCHLFLKVRDDSVYKEDYTKIEVWVNRNTWLPDRLTADSVQGDFYDLKWTTLKANKKVPEDVFVLDIPTYFRKNKHPLEK